MQKQSNEKIIVQQGGERLDVFLTEYFEGEHTRSQIALGIKKGDVTVNGEAVKTGAVLKNGDTIDVNLEKESLSAEPENIKICVVYEDEYLMIVNKPRGMVVHPGNGIKNGTLLNGLLFRGQTDVLRAGIVHRLDKNTAGLLVVAKTASVQAKLAKMFEKHEVRRVYVGIVEGQLKQTEGIVNENIVRDPNRRTLFKTTNQLQGRTAVTHYKVVRQFSKWSLVQFELETGRTHQIRVHCKSLGHALIGDPEYNPNSSVKASGQMLESISLEFTHPITGKQLKFTCEVTEEFNNILGRLE